METSNRCVGKNKIRLPMTAILMEILREEIKRWSGAKVDKLLLWAVATLAWNGGFRIDELLCRDESVFDASFCLLAEDVVMTTLEKGEEVLLVTVKCPKEDKSGKGAVVEVFASEGKLCAVNAFKNWKRCAVVEQGLPLFRWRSGSPLTGRKLNVELKNLLGKHLDYSVGGVTCHSFRAGLATELATRGLTDDDIKLAGRWSSRVFETYLKLPRTRRATVARVIAKL